MPTDPTPTHLLLAALAVWRLAHLLVHEAGPGGVLVQLRAGRLQGVLGCLGRTSLWLALVPAAWLGQGLVQTLLLTLALSGAALLLHRATTPAAPVPLWLEGGPPAAPAADEENPHVLLRQPPSGV